MISDRNYGVIWRIIAALAGLVLFGASPPSKTNDTTQASGASGQLKQAENSITSSISRAAKANEIDGGCQQQQDKRDSDLCAQWKAADAARDAADFAYWTLLISTIGTALLIWTLWETRETSRRELRAYLTFGNWQITHFDVEQKLTFGLCLENKGQTPAFSCSASLTSCVMPTGYRPNSIEAFKKTQVSPCGSIHQESEGKIIPLTLILDDKTVQEFEARNVVIWLLCRAEYIDVFGKCHVEQTTHFFGGAHDHDMMVPTDLFAIHT